MTTTASAPAHPGTARSSSAPHGVGYAQVVAAAAVVRRHLGPTPLQQHPLLDAVVGRPVLVKHENTLPTGSFKVRGGVHLAATLTDAERAAGLITCSTGNHAQSVAYGARLAGVRATIVMPTTAPVVKQEAVAALGARVVLAGESLGEAAVEARARAGAGRAVFVCPTDVRIVLGHATAYLEIADQLDDLGLRASSVHVPVGSGTGAAGACVVRDARLPGMRVVGVQSSAAPAAWRSWRSGRLEQAPARTRASGLATTTGYALPQAVLREGLDDFVLVDDDAIDRAAALLASRAHTLAEGAGAASLAGLLAPSGVAAAPGAGVAVIVCTGANASSDEIARLSR